MPLSIRLDDQPWVEAFALADSDLIAQGSHPQ